MGDPWFKFYPSDWRSDPRLRMCGIAARGLWIEMIALMHEAIPYGHLIVSGHSPTDAQLAVLAGTPSDLIPELLGELESAGVFSRTKEGVIYSRKMTRTAKKAAVARRNGKNGGNPSLRKQTEITASDNQNPTNRVKPQKPEARYQKLEDASHLVRASDYDRIIEAATVEGVCNPGIPVSVGKILDLVAKGYDLDRDILPSIRRVAKPSISNCSYFVKVVVEDAAARAAIPAKAAAPEIDWAARLDVWRRDDYWPLAWGPKPGARDCKVPAHLIEQEHAA